MYSNVQRKCPADTVAKLMKIPFLLICGYFMGFLNSRPQVTDTPPLPLLLNRWCIPLLDASVYVVIARRRWPSGLLCNNKRI
jgi:hypothetical protein